jgi:hypothetical protein
MAQDSEPTTNSVQAILGAIASVLGLILIAFGLWALGGAIYAAWELFRDPDSIANFARYFLETAKIGAYPANGGDGAAHLFSWFVVILLLLVLGKLGDWAITVGVQLLNVRDRQRS